MEILILKVYFWLYIIGFILKVLCLRSLNYPRRIGKNVDVFDAIAKPILATFLAYVIWVIN